MAWHYLDLADCLLIAEAVLETPAEDLAGVIRLDLAESALHAPAASFGGVEFYPDLESKTAVLCSRIIRNHPLPDGNKRLGYLCALEFVARNGGTWTPPENDPEGDETVPSSKHSPPANSASLPSPPGSVTDSADPPATPVNAIRALSRGCSTANSPTDAAAVGAACSIAVPTPRTRTSQSRWAHDRVTMWCPHRSLAQGPVNSAPAGRECGATGRR